MLVVFGGLPGTGKSTIARVLAARHRAVYLRIDVIEQALRRTSGHNGPIGPEGYAVAGALAESNLALGQVVIADCVNPVPESRAGWRAVAQKAQVPLLGVEIICSDPDEHRRRIEGRLADIEGLVPPTWQAVQARHFAPWPEPHMVIDTAHVTAEEAVTRVAQAMSAREGSSDG